MAKDRTRHARRRNQEHVGVSLYDMVAQDMAQALVGFAEGTAQALVDFAEAVSDAVVDFAEMVLLGTVWCRGEFNEVIRPTSEAELLAMVADLIDPVCRVVTSGEWRGRPIGSACSACHVPLSAFTRGEMDVPAYCGRCGSRVRVEEE